MEKSRKDEIKHKKIKNIEDINIFAEINTIYENRRKIYENDKNSNYNNIIKYYKKIRINNPYINYFDLRKEEYYYRTNNN